MKKIITKKGGLIVLLIISSMALSGCKLVDYFTKQSGNEYRNAISEKLNEMTPLVEQSLAAYDEAMPDDLTEKSVIEIQKLEEGLEKIQMAIEKIDDALTEESFDTTIQTTMEEKLTTEKQTLEAYKTAYNAMVIFYENGTYKEKLSEVETYDNTTEDAYNAVVDAHDATVDVLSIE